MRSCRNARRTGEAAESRAGTMRRHRASGIPAFLDCLADVSGTRMI